MPDELVLKKTYSKISSDYGETVSLVNASNSWFFQMNMSKEKGAILDVGCGTGDLLSRISKYFSKSFGIDPVPEMISIAKTKDKLSTFVKASAEDIPFPNSNFDYVVSQLAFQHTDREQALSEVIRVLKPGGKLVLSEVIIQPESQLLNLYAIIYRNFYTYPNLILHYGLAKTIKAIKYLGSPEWRELTNIHRKRRFTLDQFKQFYSRFLPGAKFFYLDMRIECVIWEK